MKTGLLFGSFNPVHTGHLIIASHMCEYGELDKVIFILSPHNPFKEESGLLDENSRLSLLRSAVAGNPLFQASDIEFNLSRPSYTINTLRHLSKTRPGEEFVLIIGADNLSSFHLWKDHGEILEKYKIYTYPRSGSEGGELASHPSIRNFNAPVLDISATFIRDTISNGHSARYLVPGPVLDEIELKGYYLS
jgi:nicotinate-nucleotide adenylyltransferase